MKKSIICFIVASFIFNVFTSFPMLKKQTKKQNRPVKQGLTDLPPELICHICTFLNYNFIDTDNFIRSSKDLFRGGLYFLKHECKEVILRFCIDSRRQTQTIRKILDDEIIQQWMKAKQEHEIITVESKKVYIPPKNTLYHKKNIEYEFKTPEEIDEMAPLLYNNNKKKQNHNDAILNLKLRGSDTIDSFFYISKRIECDNHLVKTLGLVCCLLSTIVTLISLIIALIYTITSNNK